MDNKNVELTPAEVAAVLAKICCPHGYTFESDEERQAAFTRARRKMKEAQ